MRHHFRRELIFREEYIVAHDSEEQHENVLTKSLSNAVFLLPPGLGDEWCVFEMGS